MKRSNAWRLVVGASVLVWLSVGITAAKADEVKVTLAEQHLAEVIKKGGLLTDSFTEQGKANIDAASYNIAKQLSNKMRDFVISGIQHGATCDQINSKAAELTSQMVIDISKGESEFNKKQIVKFEEAFNNVAAALCEDLNE